MSEVYKFNDAAKEIGLSTDWLLGLEVSIKKWEQIVGGNDEEYKVDELCGLCYISVNRAKEENQDACKICMDTFPAMTHLCKEGVLVEEIEPKRMLAYMRSSLTRLRKKEPTND